MAQCAKAVSRAERPEVHNAKLEASIASKDAKLKCQAKGIEELNTFKPSVLDRIKDLEGQMETLTVEAAQAEVSTRAFTLKQEFRGSLTTELGQEGASCNGLNW